MIVAVEGSSAAGKTTWCARHGRPVVAEYARTGLEPDGSDEDRQAAYWAGVNAARWQAAVTLEQTSPIVLCDSDPLKLHYSWCLARVGATPWSRFEHELHHARAGLEAGRLGLADLVVVSIPSVEVLERRKAGDHSRRRRAFALHATLGDPLREWYAAVEAVGAARVRWSFPEDGVPDPATVRRRRTGGRVLERVLDHLRARTG